ncbi:DUF3077 domain-containing protein [Pseudomonas lijiangensis]|uniref:DUF6124 family protein n=1 Tax=Pseudomonas syringae group TaxID=136849 RepID=UPI001E4AEB28|nr:DUF3077 domain-containing protein [Pseudomonas cichorii]
MLKMTSELPCQHPARNLEDILARASELLSCAAATAYESGDRLSGSHRHLALSVVHLVEMAKAEVDRSLEGLSVR